MELPVHIGKRIDSGRKEKDKARQAVFLTPTNLFGNDPEEKEPHDDCTFPQKVHTTKMLYIGYDCYQSAGSRIEILAKEVICNHDPRHDTERLH